MILPEQASTVPAHLRWIAAARGMESQPNGRMSTWGAPSRARISREPIWLQAKALRGAVDQGLGGAHLSLTDGPGRAPASGSRLGHVDHGGAVVAARLH